MSEIFGHDPATPKDKPKPEVWTEDFMQILTNEKSRSFFCENVDGKLTVTNESVKSFVLEKLYELVSKKISQLDPDYQEILNTKGDYTKYKYYAIISQTVKSLSSLIKEQKGKMSDISTYQLEEVFKAHDNLVKNVKSIKDAFTYDIVVVKQYYLVVVSSIIYSLGFVVSTMIDYERRDAKVPYDLIFKNVNIMERGLPKNMMSTIQMFNTDIQKGAIIKTVNTMKNKKPSAMVQKEGAKVSMEFGITTATALWVGVGIISIIILLPLIRHLIYFFLHTKVRLSEYCEQQANYLELNIRALRSQGADPKIIEKQEKAVKKLQDFAAKLSGDIYNTQKKVDSDIQDEDRDVVREADRKEKDSGDDLSDSEVVL